MMKQFRSLFAFAVGLTLSLCIPLAHAANPLAFTGTVNVGGPQLIEFQFDTDTAVNVPGSGQISVTDFDKPILRSPLSAALPAKYKVSSATGKVFSWVFDDTGFYEEIIAQNKKTNVDADGFTYKYSIRLRFYKVSAGRGGSGSADYYMDHASALALMQDVAANYNGPNYAIQFEESYSRCQTSNPQSCTANVSYYEDVTPTAVIDGPL